MRSAFPRSSGVCAFCTLLLGSPVHAETGEAARAVLWYRSSEGCPDGAAFLASLGDRGSAVRLAEAGDHADFVVSLATTAEGARGRLELETERGTVAVRDVDDTSCERVARVLALNLALALEPARGESPSDGNAAPPEANEPTPSTPEAEAAPDDAPAPAPESPADPSALHSAPAPSPPEHPGRPKLGLRVGLQGGLVSGVGPSLMGRGAVFVEARRFVSWAPSLALRLAGVGAFGSSETRIGTVEQTLWAGRLELCPFAWGGPRLSAAPCAAAEVGQLSASGPLSDATLWSALSAHVRGNWLVAPPFSLEADVGANFPLGQYDVATSSATLYGSTPVGVYTSLGASLAFE